MKQFAFNLKIKAANGQEASTRAKALATIGSASAMDTRTLAVVANTIKNEPAKVALLKSYLGL